MEIPVVKVPIQIPAQVFLRHPLVDPGLPLRGGSLIGSALDPLGVNPEGLHFPMFDGPASLHHPMDVWHGAPPLRVLVTLLMPLTGAYGAVAPPKNYPLRTSRGTDII